MSDKSLYAVDKESASDSTKNKALETALTQIEKSFGKRFNNETWNGWRCCGDWSQFQPVLSV